MGDRVHGRAALAHVPIGANIVNKSRILYTEAENNRPAAGEGISVDQGCSVTLFPRFHRES